MRVTRSGPHGSTTSVALPRTTEVMEFFRRQDRDALLLAAIADGDRLAFREFYERHAPKVASSLRSLCRGTMPEDLFQEVFLAVWRKAASFDSERGDVGGWMFTICRNKVYDQHRRSDPPTVEALEIDLRTSPATDVVQLSLETAMGELRDGEREALQMVYFGGYSYGQAAARLDVPLGTLKSRLRSAVRKLSERLGTDP